MPKRRRSRKRSRSRKRGRRRGPSLKEVARKVNRLSRNRQVQITTTSAVTTAAVDDTGYVHGPLFPIAKGSNENERNGDKVKILWGGFDYWCEINNSGGAGLLDAWNQVRVVLVQRRDITPTGPPFTGPSWSNLIGAVLEVNKPLVYAGPDAKNRPRWKVLYDKTHYVGDGTSGFRSKTRRNRVSLTNMTMDFDASGNAADINKGAIYLLALSTSSAVLHPTISFQQAYKFINI